MIETKFTLYRLRIESFMAGVPASESETKMIAEFILKHLMDIAFLDGNGEEQPLMEQLFLKTSPM